MELVSDVNIELIYSMYKKLEETEKDKTKIDIVREVKKKLKLKQQDKSIEKAIDRYIKKKSGVATTTKVKKKSLATKTEETKAKIQAAIIINDDKKTDKQIIEELGVSKDTFYKYSKEVRKERIEETKAMTDRVRSELYEDAYKTYLNLKSKKREILEKLLDKIVDIDNMEAQGQVKTVLSNFKMLETEMAKELQVINLYTVFELEKQLTEEKIDINRFNLEERKIMGEEKKDTEIVFKLKEEELKIKEIEEEKKDGKK